MLLELEDRELQLLSELLESAHTEALHELHHTDTSSYKNLLRQRIALVEALRAKLEQRALWVGRVADQPASHRS